MDCSTLSPVTPTSPVYFQCWGNRALPATLSYSAGPTTNWSAIACNDWPTSVITGTLYKGLFGNNLCNAIWSTSVGTNFGIIFNYNGFASNLLPVSCTINQASMTGDWSIGSIFAGVTYSLKSGSCSQASPPESGLVTMTFSTTITSPYGGCVCPITVSFSG